MCYTTPLKHVVSSEIMVLLLNSGVQSRALEIVCNIGEWYLWNLLIQNSSLSFNFHTLCRNYDVCIYKNINYKSVYLV